MQLFSRVEDFPADYAKPLVLALGFFDGLHLGHQKILNSAVQSAKKLGTSSAVFTFQNHPQTVLKPDSPAPVMITSSGQKKNLLEQSGIDLCFSLLFTEEFSKIDAEIFVKEILLKKLKVKKVCLGYNAHFGRARQGNPEFMRQAAARLGFEFEEIGPVEIKGEPVSSSRIRKLIQSGDMALAAECLGRPYSLEGRVIKGDGRGAQIGFPTANLETKTDLFPAEGVYPARVKDIEGKTSYEAVLNFGRRPTFKGGDPKPLLEVHLLDFQGNLYGKDLEVAFYPRIRAERAFPGVSELQLQISKDVEAARRYFAQS